MDDPNALAGCVARERVNSNHARAQERASQTSQASPEKQALKSKPRKASEASERAVGQQAKHEKVRALLRGSVRLRACVRCSSVVVRRSLALVRSFIHSFIVRANAARNFRAPVIPSFVRSFINCLLSQSMKRPTDN